MKKVTAFVGSARKGNTYDAVVQFLGNLKAMGDIETEIVRHKDAVKTGVVKKGAGKLFDAVFAAVARKSCCATRSGAATYCRL